MIQLPKLLIFSLLLTIVGCSKEYNDSALVGRVNNLESRVLKLEQLCQQMNTNISSLQTIVSALQNNDYVTGVVPVTEGGKTIGYTISFTKSQPVTIYHGKDGVDGKNGTDGKDGQNGADGKDGKSYVPVIGVRQDTDGVYYWTLDGKWLIDGSGNKVKAEGRDGKNGADGKDGLNGSDGRDGADGKNGQDGADGKDGANGADGRDGITPVLKIEDNYWFISYDNGGSWTKLGKATGENGRDGVDGKDGKDGENGRDGVDGKDGKEGENGRDGVDGKDGITPLLRIVDGYWYASYDNGSTWQELGKATGADGKDGRDGTDGTNGVDGRDGDSFFRDVTQDDAKVHFILADGTVITIPKAVALDIVFAESDLVVMSPNSTRTISFTVTSTIKPVTIEVVSSADVKAKVISDDADGLAGKIQLTTGSVIDEYSKVVVFVSNGEKVIMRSIRFEEAGLKVEENSVKTISADGGEVSLEFLTNVECEVVIPDDAKSWISVIPYTRALEKHSIGLLIQPNEGAARIAGVFLKSLDAKLCVSYSVSQDANINYQTAIERDALIAIYNALDGDNWEYKDNWCSDKPVNEWYGVTCGENNFVEHLNLSQPTTPMKGSIPPEIGNLSHLKSMYFWLYSNEIFPEEIGKCKELEGVNITIFNSADKRIEFPVGLYDCVNLEYLTLAGVGLSGVLSPKIAQLKKLKTLDLGSNYFQGPLPEEIGELVNLENLNMRGAEQNIGELPHSIGNLKNLKQISLSQMSGDLPKELGELSNLEALWLYSEYPITSIPDEIYNIKTLKHLELSFTKFPYTIPESIGNLTELEDLCINYDLTGTIPESIGNLTKLKYMTLANPFPQGGESLSGDIPESLQNLEYWPYFWADVIYGHPNLNTKNLKLPALHIQAKDLDGNPIDTHEIYKNNRLTIVYSWDDVCPSAKILHPILKELYEKYSNKSLDIIGYVGGQMDDYIKELVVRDDIPWKNFSGSHYLFKNGQCMAPGFITGLAIVVDSSGQIVYETQTGDYEGLRKYVEKTFGVDMSLYESADYSDDGEVETLQTAEKGNGIDIVLMGDAYSDRQVSTGTYDDDMKNLYNNLFTEEPFKSFREFFNVYYVKVISKNEGYGTYNETALSGYFGDGTLVGGNDSKCFEYAAKAVGEQNMDETLVVVAMNSNNYAGTCYMYNPSSTTGTYGSGASVAYFPKGGDKETFARLLHHEACGHGFAKLADEYAYESMGAVPSDYASQIQTQQSSWGWWKNVDFTGDVSSVRWNAFTNDSRYANEGLGAFEGGLTYWTGVWRPTENSIMRDNTGGFNAPSREAIYCRIHKLAYGDSWNYSYEDFVAYDEINRKASSSSAPRRSSGRQTRWEPLHPPVVVGKSWKEAAKTQ